MNTAYRKYPSIICAMLWLTVAWPVVHAQESADPERNGIDPISAKSQQVAAKIDEINSAMAEYQRLQKMLGEAQPAFQDLLRRRIHAKEILIVESVNSLARSAIRLKVPNDITLAQRTQIIDWLQALEPWLRAYLARNGQVIVDLLDQQATVTPDSAILAAINLRKAIANAVDANEATFQVVINLEGLGMDASAQKQALVARLLESAEMLAIAVQVDADDFETLKFRASVTPDDAEIQTLIKAAEVKRRGYATSLADVSDILNELGVDPSEYRSMVLLITGDVAGQLLDTGVIGSLARQWGRLVREWLSDNGMSMAVKVVVFVLILLAFKSLSKITRAIAERGVGRMNVSHLLRQMVVSSLANLVMFFGILIAIAQLGVSIGPLLAGLSVVGFIVGFALQDTLGNFASGMMILMYRPYDVGDIIEIAGATGKVKNMSLVNTTILTLDNQRLTIPNNKIWGDVIRNVTAQRTRRVDLVFGISYSDDIEKAEKVLQQIIDDDERALKEPAPVIRVHQLGDSSVNFVVRPWVRTDDYWDVYWAITREVKMRFDREGISIPFPQRDVHHHYEKGVPPGNTQ